MNSQARVVILLLVVVAGFFVATSDASGLVGVCIRNCAQCKKMYGVYFEGQLCADRCIKYKGKPIPDCEDPQSIEPYIITKPLEDYLE